MELRLSWPPRGLQPHAKGHWAPKARATRAHRQEAAWEARRAGVKSDARATLRFTFHPPNRRRRDLQNMPSTCKALIDGIADAMGCDDNGFRVVWPSEFSEPVNGGAVVVTIETGIEETA